MKTSALPQILALLWLIALSVFAVVQESRLSALTPNGDDSLQTTQIAVLETRLNELSSQLASQPESLTQANWHTIEQTWQQRLDALEQRLPATDTDSASATAEALSRLSERLDQFDARLETLRSPPVPPPTPPSRSPRPIKPQTLAPPFTLLGVELRGGEQRLSIAPSGSATLAQVRLLRLGDHEGDWVLIALDSRHATFRVGNQQRQFPLP